MRSRSLFALLAPLFVGAIALPPTLPSTSTLPRPLPAQSDVQISSDHIENVLKIEVPFQADDDSFLLSVEVPRQQGAVGCANAKISLNGQDIQRDWSQDILGLSSFLTSENNLTVESVSSQSSHVLHVQTRTVCVMPNRHSDENQQNPVQLVEFTTFRIVAVDGQPLTLPVGFTTSLDAFGHGFNRVPDVTDLETLFSLQSKNDEGKRIAQSDAEIDMEISRLKQLEQQLRGIQQTLDGQKQLVDHLSEEQYRNATNEFNECESVGCYLQTLYRKTRTRLRDMYQHYSPLESSVESILNQAAQDARRNTSRALTNSYTSSASTSINHLSTTSQTITTSTASCRSSSQALHLTLDIVAILSTLILIAALIHARLHNPRYLADRAALREERQTAKAYRRLARKQAWKNWWNRRLLRRDTDPRIHDYEEKRALIQAQEAVLEGAMQREIGLLTEAHEVGTDIGNAEEGRAVIAQGRSAGLGIRISSAMSRTSSEGAPPPTYRSRASSNGLPKYSEHISCRADVTAFVRDGFGVYTPNGTAETPDASDFTPDSSVMALSPRHSSETLRTE